MNIRFSATLLMMLTVAFISCRSQSGRVTVGKFDNNRPRIIKWFKMVDGDTVYTHEIHYYANGQKSLEGALDNDLRDSTWTTWREDGKLWSQSTYKKGRENGVSVTYHATGQKYYEGQYFNGHRVGIWRFYDETGREVNTQDFGRAPVNGL